MRKLTGFPGTHPGSSTHVVVKMAGISEVDVEGVCHEYVAVGGQETPKLLAKGIQTGKIDLLKIVEALGVFLTSTNVENRAQGTKLLSEVLSHLHSYTLLPDDVHYLAVFYCDRLKDRAVVMPHVLCGLHALVAHQKLVAEDVVNISRTIFQEVPNQSMQQTHRSLLYSIMDTFLTCQIEALQTLGSEFVLGYIQAVDGERDPRNLVTVFKSVATITRHLDFSVLAEDLFEVTSCYFPIDFVPPPNDPQAVSRDQLILGLRNCLIATPKFAEFCLPLLLEKLSSDVQSAKLDSLLTLAAGAGVYGVEGLKPFVEPLWHAIKREVFQSVSEEVEDAGLQSLMAVTRTLSSPLLHSRGKRGEVEEFVDMIVKDCKHLLCEPGLRLIHPSGKLLQAAARASDPACTRIISAVVPLMVEQLAKQTQVAHKRTIVEVLLDFIKIMKSFSYGRDVLCPLLPFKDSILSLILPAMGDSHASLRVVSIAAIAGLLDLESFLEEKEVSVCAEHLKRLALTDIDATVRKESSLALGFLAKLHPSVVRDEILPTILPTLATVPVPMEVDHLPRYIHLLASLSTHHDIISLTLPALLNYLDLLGPSLELVELARTASYGARAIVEGNITENRCLSFVGENVVSMVMKLCIGSAAVGSVLTDNSVVENMSALLRSYSQALDVSLSQSLLDLVMGVFLTGSNLATLGLNRATVFLPLQPSSPHQQTQLVSLLTAAVGPLPADVVRSRCSDLLAPLLHMASQCPHSPSCVHAAKCYASIINKMADGGELMGILDRDSQLLWRVLCDCSCDKDERLRALTIWIWLTKSLVMRSHPNSKGTSLKLLQLLGDADLSSQAAEGFQLILADTEDVLNRNCHANVRMMHKQQFFVAIAPEIVQRFHTTAPGEQQYLLKALSHVMQGVPKQVLLGELPLLLPLLLESLQCEEAGLRLSTLEALKSLTHDAPSVIAEHVTAIIPRLLELAQAPDSMKVRIMALRCVGAMTTLPLHVVYPYKTVVVRKLALCLDDKKRLVRKEATKSRSDWFLLGAV